ncbi:hypothetical protein BC834DRAFT_855841 [Gloeopeniophorella convolvens]|nr:hypothetical protein BC834DRAFT_855841 [Gloeopeniophorella convolvens]
MPRRPAPTPLRLIQGSLPPRGRSKFTMPSMPRPIFYPPAVVARCAAPRERQRPVEGSASRSGSPGLEQTPEGLESPGSSVRGPWDHSGTISIPLDAGTVVAPPKAAMGPVY